MFYSQFILAKKGPLGTIWIAAHLERKLRKNQVADTDIGFSVDSIIFPDVPIALRLSSHLLLGVVRIYSRKVGYLFDDCSEALLKVKQAFRSSAVDLPPEESTAPYHSITLPETFDLDDFELPDSEIFQGNYVDHHVSAKEQITLQDTMDGVVYSTSQFGLDERFGDGDACQIGLDLSEEALLGQAVTPTNDGAFNDDPHASLSQMTPLEEVDNDNDDIILADSSKIMSPNHGGFQQADILDTKPESSEYAEAPATPILVEEANLPTTQGALVSDDLMDPEPSHGDMEAKEAETKEYLEPTAECGEHGSENGLLASPSPHPAQEKSVLSVSQFSNGEMKLSGGADGLNNGTDRVERTNLSDGETERTNCGRLEAQQDITMGDGSATKGDVDGLEVCKELKNQDTDSKLQKDEQSKFMQGLHPCNSNIYQNEAVAEGSEQCFSADVAEVAVCEIQTIEPALKGKLQTNAGELLDQFYNEALKDISGNGGSNTEPPSPEKLLSASDLIADKQNDLLADSTPNMEGLEDGLKRISGRKRTLTESAASMQRDSLETFGLSKSRQTKESIPNDDDLLSSILVGRGSSVLKMKPTPAPTEVISKRPRTTQRSAASKRKMLMDETMVLLGDMIRQQLTSAEDLRRVRKKAPCTLSEISMIHRQFLEDEIFYDPLLAGISTELFFMHRETYDVSRTKICEIDKTTVPAETTKESSAKPDVTEESEKGASQLPIRDHGEVQAAETFLQDQNYQDEELVSVSHFNESEMMGDGGECSDMLEKIELDEGKAEGAEVPSAPTVSDLDMAVPVDARPEDTCTVPGNLFTEVNMMDKVDIAGELHISPEYTLTEHNLRKDSIIIDVHAEGADAEQSAHVTQDELQTVGSVDDQSSFPTEHGILPGDHGESSTEPAAIRKAEDGPTLAESNKDLERVGRSGGDAVEAYIESSGLLKHDGSFFEHEVHKDNASLIGDEETRFCEDVGGRDTDAMDGYQDHENMGIIHDTDFLNVDDDEFNEDDEHQSDAEDSRLLDNSGWSSRTRAVANYLQTLFDREVVHGKSNLPMDRLLVGKTRKEASRMFFESLVLKTRDYIQVKQPKPFDNINLQPRSKLMKSQF